MVAQTPTVVVFGGTDKNTEVGNYFVKKVEFA